jgi:hypothetical protein
MKEIILIGAVTKESGLKIANALKNILQRME